MKLILRRHARKESYCMNGKREKVPAWCIHRIYKNFRHVLVELMYVGAGATVAFF